MSLCINLSLRLWSDLQKLDALLPEFALPPRHLHHKGEAVPLPDTNRQHMPRRHYASFPPCHATDTTKVEPWLDSELEALERRILTSGLIRTGVVEAVFWIAIFSDAPIATPTLSTHLVERLRASGARALIESYAPQASTQTASPSKTWYPPEAAPPTNASHTP